MTNRYKNITYNVDLYSRENSFKLLAFIIDCCNYNCEYCYNEFPRSNKKLDLNKLYFFISEILIKKLNKQYIYLELIGGEPTLHPALQSFCKKLSTLENVYITIYTNFSKDVEYYKTLLEINNRISLILSWHTANTQFKEKLSFFSKEQISKKITVSVIYEHNNIDKALEIFDYVRMTYPYIKELSFPLIDDSANYHGKTYSEKDMIKYNKRLTYIKDLTQIKIQYNDNTFEIVDQHYFITDEKNKCFKYWLCNAGIDFCFVYFNGDICPCDGYRNIPINNINTDKIVDFTLNKKPIFCKVEYCPCVFDVYKKLIFRIHAK